MDYEKLIERLTDCGTLRAGTEGAGWLTVSTIAARSE